VAVPPLAIGTVVEESADVRRYQVIQTGPNALRIRLEVAAGMDRQTAWEDVALRLRAYLETLGLAASELALDPDLPRQEFPGGKFRQVLITPGTWQEAPHGTTALQLAAAMK
jgi:hypothetical protein